MSEEASQDDIESLLREAQASAGDAAPAADDAPAEQPQPAEVAAAESKAPAPAAPTAPAAAASAAPPPTDDFADAVSPEDVELLLSQAEQAIASIDSPAELPPGVAPFALSDFGGTPANSEAATLELVRDVQLDMKIELGRTHMHLEDVLRLRQGAVVPLDKLAGDPVDLYVNGRMIAHGEVLVLNDNFCVRVTELIVGDSACA